MYGNFFFCTLLSILSYFLEIFEREGCIPPQIIKHVLHLFTLLIISLFTKTTNKHFFCSIKFQIFNCFLQKNKIWKKIKKQYPKDTNDWVTRKLVTFNFLMIYLFLFFLIKTSHVNTFAPKTMKIKVSSKVNYMRSFGA